MLLSILIQKTNVEEVYNFNDCEIKKVKDMSAGTYTIVDWLETTNRF